jgi:hypothetical protein
MRILLWKVDFIIKLSLHCYHHSLFHILGNPNPMMLKQVMAPSSSITTSALKIIQEAFRFVKELDDKRGAKILAKATVSGDVTGSSLPMPNATIIVNGNNLNDRSKP